MTSDRETTRIVRSWLQLGVDQLPERVLDAVLDELPAIPQRRSPWSAWRSAQMPSFLKLAAAVAAVLVIAVVGLRLLPSSGGIGGSPAASPTPATTVAPSAAPSAAPTSSLSPTPSPSRSVIDVGGTGEQGLAAGTYRVPEPFVAPFTITFPSAWTASVVEVGGMALYRTEPANFAPAMVIDRVDKLHADPCHPDSGSPAPSAAPLTADEIVAQLSAMTGFTAGPVSDVTVGGHPAKSFVLTNDVTLDEARQCTGSPLDIWDGDLGRNTTNQGSRDHIWVVDVNGTPLTIDVQSAPGQTSADLITEAEAIVSSIQFDQ